MKNYTIESFKLSEKLNESQFIKVLELLFIFMLANKQLKRNEIEFFYEFQKIHGYWYLNSEIIVNKITEKLNNHTNQKTGQVKIPICIQEITDELLFLNYFDRMQILSLIEFIVDIKWEWVVWLELTFTTIKYKFQTNKNTHTDNTSDIAKSLIMLVLHWKYDIVSDLMAKWINPNLIYKWWTTLFTTIATGDEKMMKLLLDYWADTKIQVEWETVLIASIQQWKFNLTKLLIEYWADIEEKNYLWSSPIVSAIVEWNPNIVEFLIKMWANINIKVHWVSLLQLAYAWGNNKIIELLLKELIQ